MEYYKYLLSGLLIVGFLNQGLAKPTKHSPTNEMQGDDDYNYNDDDADTISDTITTSNAKSTMPPSLQETLIKKSAIEGDNLQLQCPVLNRADNNVIFWYIGEKLISNQNAIVNKRYKLKNTNTSYTLIINDIKMDDAGEYYCKVYPQNLQLQVSVNVLPKGSILENTPSTEKSKLQNSSSMRIHSSYTILVSLILGMLTYLRI